MGRPAFAQEPPPLFDDRLTVPEWPEELPSFHISREQFKQLGHTPTNPAVGFRTLSFDRLGYLYSVDRLDIRDKVLREFGYRQDGDGNMVPAPVIAELGITEDPASGIDFAHNPFTLDSDTTFCPPKELDFLDVKSMCDFTRNALSLVRQGRSRQEQRDILTWKAGKRTQPRMIEHYVRAGRGLMRAAARNHPELDNQPR